MADAWLLWAGGVLALVFLVLLTLAGIPPVGVFLAAVVWLAARRAVKPEVCVEVDDSLRGACDRLPFCDCSPARRR